MNPGARIEWSEFFERYRAMGSRMASGLLSDASAGDDLYQEAVRALILRARSRDLEFESVTHARNYLFRTLHNLAHDARRVSSRVGELDEQELPAKEREESGAESGPLKSLLDDVGISPQHLDEALRSLPETSRFLLRERFLEGRSYREISERKGISISTLQARVEAGLARIRRKLGKPGTGG